MGHSAILSTFSYKLHFVNEIFVLSIFELQFTLGFFLYTVRQITVMRTRAEESTGDKNRDSLENS